jgi:hypothetical protein
MNKVGFWIICVFATSGLSAQTAVNSLEGLPGSVTFAQIGDDGTNRHYSISGNGRDRIQLASEANTTFLNGNRGFAGLVCGPASTSVDTAATLLSLSTSGKL